MSHVPLSAPPVGLLRSPMVNQLAAPRAPVMRAPTVRLAPPQQRPPVARNRLPQFLPVLQPPLFPRDSDLYEDERFTDDQLFQTVALADQHRQATRSLFHTSRMIPSAHLFTRSFKLFGFRHSPYVYYY